MVDTEVVAGLAIGYFGSQFLGNFVESKVKPDIVDASTSQDKIIAGVANDGSKAALAYGAYSVGKTSPFMKNIAWGSALAAVIDAGWRYSHNGVPYGYKPFNIPLLGDLNEIITGPNSGSENIRTMDACSDARAVADRICVRVPTPVPTPAPAPTRPISDPIQEAIRRAKEAQKAKENVAQSEIFRRTSEAIARRMKCDSIKADATKKKRTYTKAEKDMCIGYLSMSDTDTDSVEDILLTGYELLAAPPMSPAKKQSICDSIKAEAITTNRPYTAQEMEMCTGLLDGSEYKEYSNLDYTTPAPGTSPGDITPSPVVDPSAPIEDEDPVSTIPDRKNRFSFMEENTERVSKQFGFALGSPISGREKYFGMKT